MTQLPAAIDNEDATEFGPAMLALRNDRLRAFVLAVMRQGTTNYGRAALVAGYPEEYGPTLAHKQPIQDALREESHRRLGASLPMAASVLVALCEDPTVAARDRARIAANLLDRGGLGVKTEHTVKVEHKLDEAGLKEQIENMAKELGMDPAVFLGGKPIPRALRPKKDDLEIEAIDITDVATEDWTL